MLIFNENVKKEDLNKKLISKLELLELYTNEDLIITSGFRTPEKNKEIGGNPSSSHLKGLAVDIFCDNGNLYWKIRESALNAGFKRIGHGKDHVHLDIDKDKAQNCEWWEN